MILIIQYKKKNPWIAPILSCIPTAGHYYASDWQRGFPMLGWVYGGIFLGGSQFIISSATLWSMIDSYHAVNDYNQLMIRKEAGFDATTLPSVSAQGVSNTPYNTSLAPFDYDAAVLGYNQQKKNETIASLLSLIPTMGHYYAGDWGRGLRYLGWNIPYIMTMTALAITTKGFSQKTEGMEGIGVVFLIPFAIVPKFFESEDARRTARLYNQNLKTQLGLSFRWPIDDVFSAGISYRF